MEEANEYFHCINILRARERLIDNQVASWPHMDKNRRSNLHKKILKEADIVNNEHKAVTASDLARILKDGRR